MSGDQVRALWLRYNKREGWSQQEFARRLGVNPASFRRWLKDGVSGPSSIVLRLLSKGKITIEDIDAAHG